MSHWDENVGWSSAGPGDEEYGGYVRGDAHHDEYFREPEEDDEELDVLPDVLLALNRLTPKQRFVIQLRYGLKDGNCYGQREIADLMGISQPNVAKLESRALNRLLKEMGINFPISSDSFPQILDFRFFSSE